MPRLSSRVHPVFIALDSRQRSASAVKRYCLMGPTYRSPIGCRNWLPAATASFALTELQAGSDALGAITTKAVKDVGGTLSAAKNAILPMRLRPMFLWLWREPIRIGRRIGDFSFHRSRRQYRVSRWGRGIANSVITARTQLRFSLMVAGCLKRIARRRRRSGIQECNGWDQVARMHVAATCVGQSDRLIEMGRSYATGRIQFGHPIADFQAVQHMLAESYAET